MLRTLIWKQFYECFRNYFVSSKTGKRKSKASIIGMFVLFTFLMLFLCLCFFGMASGIAPILDTDFKWLYYFLFSIVAISLGVFASAFNAANAIFKPKDNDLLLSMPIEPSVILISRISLVFGLCFLYVFIVWFPGCVYSFIYSDFNLLTCLLDILLLFVIALFSGVLSCLVGYIIMIISNKTKNKSFVTLILSLVFFGIYYTISFRLSSIMESIVNNVGNVASKASLWGNMLYLFAKAANGDVLSFVFVLLIVVALTWVCYYVLKKNFYSIVTKSNNVSSKKTKIVYKSDNNVFVVMLKKELKRFTSSALYMMNCGLGIIIVLLLAIVTLFKRSEIAPLIELLKSEIPEIYCFIPLIVVGMICMIISVNAIAVPSISLEGKSLWIIKSLPVSEENILNAKKTLQLIINGIPSLIASLIICLALGIDYNLMIYIFVVVLLFVEVHSSICIILALVNPNFNWTSETQPIKQSVNILLEMAISWIVVIVMVGCFYFLKDSVDVSGYLQYLVIALMVIEILLRRIIRSWGVKKLHSL